jgi:hypothetical protein
MFNSVVMSLRTRAETSPANKKEKEEVRNDNNNTLPLHNENRKPDLHSLNSGTCELMNS